MKLSRRLELEETGFYTGTYFYHVVISLLRFQARFSCKRGSKAQRNKRDIVQQTPTSLVETVSDGTSSEDEYTIAPMNRPTGQTLEKVVTDEPPGPSVVERQPQTTQLEDTVPDTSYQGEKDSDCTVTTEMEDDMSESGEGRFPPTTVTCPPELEPRPQSDTTPSRVQLGIPHMDSRVTLKHRFGIEGHLLSWLMDYLNQRSQITVVNSTQSKKLKVPCGIPQGSVLGPCLFSLYTNDMPGAVSLGTLYLYADDTTVYCIGSTVHEACSLLNKSLTELNNGVLPTPLHHTLQNVRQCCYTEVVSLGHTLSLQLAQPQSHGCTTQGCWVSHHRPSVCCGTTITALMNVGLEPGPLGI
ncbi:hypothetical protein ACROYT_G013751 [Oculina patagonica]